MRDEKKSASVQKWLQSHSIKCFFLQVIILNKFEFNYKSLLIFRFNSFLIPLFVGIYFLNFSFN